MMNGKKIAKSDGNVAFMNEVIERWFTGEDLRYFFLQAHYRSFQDFTREGLEAASKARKKLNQKIWRRCELVNITHERLQDIDLSSIIVQDHLEIVEKIADDFMTPMLIAWLFELIQKRNPEEHILKTWQENWTLETASEEQKNAWKTISNDLQFLYFLDKKILKLWLFEFQESIEIPQEIQALAERRRQAKLLKDWALADALRVELEDSGWTMKDGKETYELEFNK